MDDTVCYRFEKGEMGSPWSVTSGSPVIQEDVAWTGDYAAYLDGSDGENDELQMDFLPGVSVGRELSLWVRLEESVNNHPMVLLYDTDEGGRLQLEFAHGGFRLNGDNTRWFDWGAYDLHTWYKITFINETNTTENITVEDVNGNEVASPGSDDYSSGRTFDRLRLRTRRVGLATNYGSMYLDEICLPSDSGRDTATATETPTPSPTPSRTPTPSPRSTPMPARGRYDLENAQHSRTVSVGGGAHHILWGIPDTPPSRRAVVTTDYDLVGPRLARDALIVDVWADSDPEYWAYAIDMAERHRDEWQTLEILSQIGTVSSDVAAALALSQISPTAALRHKIDALDSAVTWQQEAIENPHREQFSKMAEAIGTLEWCHEEYATIASVAELSSEGLEVVDFAVEVYEHVETVDDVVSTAETVIAIARESDSVTKGLSAGGRVAQAKAFQMFPTIMTSYVADNWNGLLEANARTAAAGVAHNTIRLPILRELNQLHTEAVAGIIDPPDIARYHIQKMTQYQIHAIAASSMAEYQDGVSKGLLGSVLSEVFGSGDIADLARMVSRRQANLARHSIAELGAGWQLGRERFEDSINAEILGTREGQ